MILTSCTLRFAKIIAIGITVLSLLGIGYAFVQENQLDTQAKIAAICIAAFEIFLIFAVLFEFRIPLIACLFVLIAMISIASIYANIIVLEFAVTAQSHYSQLNIQTEEQAFWAAAVLEAFLLCGILIHLIRYCCVLFVYRWTTMTRVTVKNGKPRITVHAGHLP